MHLKQQSIKLPVVDCPVAEVFALPYGKRFQVLQRRFPSAIAAFDSFINDPLTQFLLIRGCGLKGAVLDLEQIPEMQTALADAEFRRFVGFAVLVILREHGLVQTGTKTTLPGNYFKRCELYSATKKPGSEEGKHHDERHHH